MAEDRRIAVNGNHNITGNNFSNFGNVTNITMGPSSQPLTLESNVAFSALLDSKERYPAPHCHPNTRVAARKAVKDWIARKGFGSEKNIMWISGGPGVGKSALLQTVCDCDSVSSGDDVSIFVDIEDDNSLIDACYFFGRGMGDREKASFFPATIAYQIVQSRTSCGAAIQAILAKKPSILLESFPSQFRKLVLRPAKARAASEAPVTIVIDALDECDSVRDQVALLNVILEAATTANVRFVIASRPELDIQTFFQRANVSRHTYHIRLDNDFKARRDIETFLCDKFADIRERRPALCPRLPNGEEWPGSIIIYRLRDDSDGQFIYATLVIAFIDTTYFSPDQQLKYLLAAPPARAFSKLDTLYRQILTRAPPELPAGSDELIDFQGLVMGILRVIVCWPEPLSATAIARVLDKEVGAVQAIILGPMCSLFKFDSNDFSESTITLCHKSLRDYLLDRLRSQSFFLPTDSPDGLYIEVLSRPSPPDTSQSYSREVLIGVLVMMTTIKHSPTVPEIASFLGAASSVVKAVIFGPTKGIFRVVGLGRVEFSTSFFQDFLLDAGRAGEFFISRHNVDTLFSQILSRQPPSDPLPSYSRELLMGVLTVTCASVAKPLKHSQIASLLDAAPSAVEAVIFGPGIFEEDGLGCVRFSHFFFWDFLLDAGRAGEFFISRHNFDTLFSQILSRQMPSDPSQLYSRELLIGVLTVVATLGGFMGLEVLEIASFLDAAPGAVEAVIFGSAKAIFAISSYGGVVFSMSHFGEFLLDASRAGGFSISSNISDTLFTQVLSRQPPSDHSQSYSRKDLIDVLTVVAELDVSLTVPEIASFLDAAPGVVEAVVFGPAKAFFKVTPHVRFSADFFKYLLRNADRAGEFFISKDMLDTLFTQILSRQPPSDHSQSYSRKDLIDVLTVVAELDVPLTVHAIASFLNAAPGVVESVVFGPAKWAFTVDYVGDVHFSTSSFKDFLLDAGRAGEFFIHM